MQKRTLLISYAERKMDKMEYTKTKIMNEVEERERIRRNHNLRKELAEEATRS